MTFRLPLVLTTATLCVLSFASSFAAALSAQPRASTITTPAKATATRAAVPAVAPFVVPAWAFPTSAAPNPAPPTDSVTPQHVPHSSRSFTSAHAKNSFDIADWFPEAHPPMPAAVQYGRRPAARACALCHLADGAGRPENATLAGLPVEYIVKQVSAFRDSSRLVANPASSVNSMHLIARSFADSDVIMAARYYSALRLTRRNRVIESATVPKTRIEIMLFALDGEGREPLDGRLIEVPEDWERHELHDPGLTYDTYVPIGSLRRGRQLVRTGAAGAATACTKCHGPQLLGVGLVPPIAGRSPSYLLRQLMNFRTGARHDDGSAPMQPVVSALTVDDMVAVSGYVGSLAPAPLRAANTHSARAH